MPTYSYVAKDRDGKTVQASLDANSRYDALGLLRAQDLTVLSLQAPGEKAGPADARTAPAQRKKKARRLLPGLYGITATEKAVFARQLAISVNSGVPLRESLESITEDMDNPTFRGILRDVVQQLHDGRTLSEAISRHGRAFSNLFVALIKTAEESGSMPQTLERLAASLERSDRLNRKIRSVLAYPIFVAVFFVIVCLVMTLFILPQFQSIFAGFRAQLPLLTRIVFRVNTAVINNFPVILAAVAAVVVAVILFGRSKGGRLRLDRMKLRLPFFGDCIRKFVVARFCRNLAIMLRGGVPVATAIEISAGTCDNKVMEAALLDARKRIIAGSDISSSIAKQKEFPRLVVRMVGVGEASGRLPDVMERVADMYEDQVEGSITVAMSLFEPVIIVFFGLIVLVLVLSIYIPVFSIASKAR